MKGALRSVIKSEFDDFSERSRRKRSRDEEDTNERRVKSYRIEEEVTDEIEEDGVDEDMQACSKLCEEDRTELLAMLEEALYEDLREQEQELLRQLEEAERTTRDQIEADVNDFLAHEDDLDRLESTGDADANDVLCPMCTKFYLRRNHSVIFCRCGLRIDAEGDGLSLGDLRQSLARAIDDHCAIDCDGRLVYNASKTFGGVSMLVASCSICDFSRVIL